jgi:hypothetical protein
MHTGIWFLSLKEIRNEYAHQLEPDVKDKLDDLFRIDDKLHPCVQELDSAADAERLNHAMQHCMEFILSLDSAKLKHTVS